jgi:hypothetical protein
MRFQRFALEDVSRRPNDRGRRKSVPEPPRLICCVGFLDDAWWHRAHWAFGRGRNVRDPITVGMRAPAGQLLVFSEETIYGFGCKPEYFMWTTPVDRRLFAADKKTRIVPLPQKGEQPKQAFLRPPNRTFATRWSRGVPLHVRAMVLAGETLFIAGPPQTVREGPPESFVRKNRLTPDQARTALQAWEGRSGALLRAVSAANGKTIAERKLDCPPVFDGMIAAYGRIYMATVDGKVVSLAGAPPDADGAERRSGKDEPGG